MWTSWKRPMGKTPYVCSIYAWKHELHLSFLIKHKLSSAVKAPKFQVDLWGETSAIQRCNLWTRFWCVFSYNSLQFQLPHPSFLGSWRDIWSKLKHWGRRIFPELSTGWVAMATFLCIYTHTHKHTPFHTCTHSDTHTHSPFKIHTDSNKCSNLKHWTKSSVFKSCCLHNNKADGYFLLLSDAKNELGVWT